MHRREEPVEVALEVARRDPDVLRARPACERVHRRVEPPGLVVEAEPLRHLELEPLLKLDRERALRRRGNCLGAGHLLHERRLVLLQVVERLAHDRALHPGLVVVEQRVVGLVVVAVEALDVALAQLQVVPQHGQEAREVVALSGLDPDGIAERRRARHLRPEVGRNLAFLLPVAAGDPDEARLEGVVLVLLLEARELVHEPADLRRDELVVRDPPERRQLLGADAGAARRHHHLLVPAEQLGRRRQVRDFAQTPAKLFEGRAHALHASAPVQRIWLASALERAGICKRYCAAAGPCSSGDGFRPRPSPTVRSVVQPEGEVVLGASPPARLLPREMPLLAALEGISRGFLATHRCGRAGSESRLAAHSRRIFMR